MANGILKQPRRLSRGQGPSERFAGALGATPGERAVNIVGGASTVVPGVGLAAKGVGAASKATKAALAAKRLRDAQRGVSEAARKLNSLKRVNAPAYKISNAKRQVNVARDALVNAGGSVGRIRRPPAPTMMEQRALLGMRKGGVVKSSRKKSKIDGIARKGHTRAKHR